jgi:hypothetical protein
MGKEATAWHLTADTQHSYNTTGHYFNSAVKNKAFQELARINMADIGDH